MQSKSPANSCTCELPLGALFGQGRGGTTWLGAVLASHPDVAYRFEPFHRLAIRLSGSLKADESTGKPRQGIASMQQLLTVLFQASPSVCKPPFFPKSFLRTPPWLRGLVWAGGRKMRPVGDLFEWLNQPMRARRLIFKEVEKIDVLEWLLRHTEVPVTYLLRDPRAVIASRLRGQRQQLMPAERRMHLSSLLHADAELAARFGDRAGTLSPAAGEALAWRLDVERAHRALEGSRHGQIVYFEQLLRDPLEETGRVLAHHGLSHTEATRQFVEISRTSASPFRRFLHGELPINRYFTVFRAPGDENRWQTDLSQAQQEEIYGILGDSPVMQAAVDAKIWLEHTGKDAATPSAERPDRVGHVG